MIEYKLRNLSSKWLFILQNCHSNEFRIGFPIGGTHDAVGLFEDSHLNHSSVTINSSLTPENSSSPGK